MFIVIALLLAGILSGYLLRNRKMTRIHHAVTALIWLLLFLLGIDVGSNEAIINGLHTIGLEALVITVAAVAGSVLSAGLLWLYVRKKSDAE